MTLYYYSNSSINMQNIDIDDDIQPTTFIAVRLTWFAETAFNNAMYMVNIEPGLKLLLFV